MPNQVRVLIVLLLFPLLANSQVARFMGRYDVSTVTYVADSTWQLSGTFIDLTGSYTGLSCDTNDKIIQRGYDSLGRIVFDRYRIMTIVSQTVNDLVVNVRSDYTGGIQNSSNMPFTGSFPIASAVSDTPSLTYRTSMYQNLIDPDYDAALDNLNLYEAKASIVGSSHWDLNGQDIHNNNSGGVAIRTDSATTNFTVAGSTNWIPSVMDSASIDDGISQSEMSRLIVYHDTNSAWFDWAYGSGSMLADGYEGQFLEIVSDTIGVLYLKNNEPTNTVVFAMSNGDNITLKYTNGTWEEWARTDHTPFFSCGDTGSPGITYIGMIGENGISVTPASISSNGTFTVRGTSIDSTFIKAGTMVSIDSTGNTYTINVDSVDFITTILPQGLNSVMAIDSATDHMYLGYYAGTNPSIALYNWTNFPSISMIQAGEIAAAQDANIFAIRGGGSTGYWDGTYTYKYNRILHSYDSIKNILYGYDKATIVAKASQLWTETHNGTYFTINTTPNNSTTPGEAVRIDQDKTVKIANIPLRANVPTYSLTDSAGMITKYPYYTYIHPAKAWVDKPDISGDSVISNLTIDALGHPTNWTKKKLTIPAGESTTVANTGDGAGQVYKSMTGTQINLKTIKAGANVTVTNNTDDITIAASTGAGGNVKYVTSGTGIDVDSSGTMYTVNNITRDSTGITALGTNIVVAEPTANNYTIRVTESDSSTTNELQNLTYDNRVVRIDGGGTDALIPRFSTTDTVSGLVKGSSGTGSTYFLNGAGNWAVPPDNNTTYTAGYGLQLIGTVFSNTRRDTTVSITGAGINVVTGTYPDFTITGTEVDGSTTNEIQTPTYTASTRLIGLSGTATTAEIPLFATAATTPGLVTGSNSVGATYFLNGTGAWSVPATGASTDSVLWSRNDTRGAMWTKYPDSVSINRIVPRKLFDVDGTAFVDDTLYISRNMHITPDADSIYLETNMGWKCTNLDVHGNGASNAISYMWNDVGFGAYDSALIISAKGNMALGTLTAQSERLYVNGTTRTTGKVVVGDSLRTEGAALVKNNLTVKNIIETQDSISIWHGVKNYRSLLTLDDDVTMAFFDNAWGHGRITAKTGATYAEFTFNEAGSVTLYSASSDVSITDTDTKMCIYPSGTGHIIIKNRMGNTQDIIINIEYTIVP